MSELSVIETDPPALCETCICVCPACGALSMQGESRVSSHQRDARARERRPEAGRQSKAALLQDGAGWLPLIHTSIQEVFGIMLGCETGSGVSETPDGSADITAMVGLAGKLRGMMSVRCTSRAACGMAEAMLGSSITDVDVSSCNDNVKDALGEVCNMVAGNFKAKLSGMADGCNLSLPTVITGADYHVHPMAFGEQVVVTCSFQGEPVWVTLDLHR